VPVQDVSFQSTTAGYLYGFKIDSDVLRTNHKNWLEGRIVNTLVQDSARLGLNELTSDATSWHIWVVGAASRTGSFKHNLALSGRRAESVRKFLGAKMGGLNVVWRLTTHPYSETLATLLGRADEVEHRFDRSVLVMMQKIAAHIPDPKPPELPRPPRETSIEAKLYFYAKRGNFAGYNRWQAELYAISYEGGQKFYDAWQMQASGIGVGMSDVNSGFVPPMLQTDYLFAGPAAIEVPSRTALDSLSRKVVWVSSRGKTLKLRINGAMPDGEPMELFLPSNTSWELTQVVGATGARQALPDKARRVLDGVVQGGPSGSLA
jgi:hypothetical protein